MSEIEALVFGLVEPGDPLLSLGFGPPASGLAFVFVAEDGCPHFDVGPLQPVHALLADPDFGGGLPVGEFPGNRLLDHRFDAGVVKTVHGLFPRPNHPSRGIGWKQITG